VTIAFGAFTLDDDRRQLLRGDAGVHLSPKAYQLLKLLIDRRPRALSKMELHDHLWPETFVSDVALSVLVAEVRAALGEHGNRGRYVRTIQRFGYAFAAEATELAVVSDPAAGCDAAGPAAARMSGWLAWGDREFELGEGEHVIGRDRAADVRIDALSISRRHARLTCRGKEATIEDLGSKNGTWVGGARVDGVVSLAEGDEIRLGSVTVIFYTLTAVPSTESAKRT
jgi:DNA-binding winged helix-turn-helix (wHTH) protein